MFLGFRGFWVLSGVLGYYGYLQWWVFVVVLLRVFVYFGVLWGFKLRYCGFLGFLGVFGCFECCLRGFWWVWVCRVGFGVLVCCFDFGFAFGVLACWILRV